MNSVPSILIVDDELENFDVIEAMLMADPYQLHYAANGVQALSFLNTHTPDLVLLDVMMPEMDGLETCRRIKMNRIWQHIPIVIITALNSKDDLVRCFEAGATDFLCKPAHRAELRARVQAMLKIKRQYDDLQALLQTREDMVHMMVHDLRNPLSSILLSTELLRMKQISPEKHQAKLDKIALAAHKLQLQIDSLLLMAKIESDKMVLNYTVVDLCEVCLAALEGVEAIAEQKHISFSTQLPQPGALLHADANVFRRILDNLLSNAIKFSPSDSMIHVRVTSFDTRGAIIQVTDQGPGVSEEVKDHIFEKYEIGTLVQGVDQTGLGLAFVKMAVEAHGGKITVENNPTRGSIFTLHLPPSIEETQLLTQ